MASEDSGGRRAGRPGRRRFWRQSSDQRADDAVPVVEAERVPYLGFFLGGDVYGLPLQQLREVARLTRLRRIPGAPSSVAGLVNLRGEIICALNAHAILGLAASAPAARRVLRRAARLHRSDRARRRRHRRHLFDRSGPDRAAAVDVVRRARRLHRRDGAGARGADGPARSPAAGGRRWPTDSGDGTLCDQRERFAGVQEVRRFILKTRNS